MLPSNSPARKKKTLVGSSAHQLLQPKLVQLNAFDELKIPESQTYSCAEKSRTEANIVLKSPTYSLSEDSKLHETFRRIVYIQDTFDASGHTTESSAEV